jgi:hypothetical protein
MPRGHQRMLLALAVVAILPPVVESLTGVESGAMYLLPLALIAMPLVFGRYLGERRLARRLAVVVRYPRRRRSATVRMRRPVVALLPRGGRLIASSLAVRPPPTRALSVR